MEDHNSLYDRVGKLIGWDFSNLKVSVEGDQWDFYTEVAERCSPDTFLLDIGTGGGERLVKIADKARLLVGIDVSYSMLATAQKKHSQMPNNVLFVQMDAVNLAFPLASFDVIACRHAPFGVEPVAAVLAENGYFLTQQVSESDKLNLKQAFGRGQAFGEVDGSAMQQYVDQLKDCGFSHIATTESNVTEYYQTADDLLFLLQHTPIIPHFGEQEDDYERLAEFIQENTTPKGIKTNSKRYLIVARI